jgi:hypothetical protein
VNQQTQQGEYGCLHGAVCAGVFSGVGGVLGFLYGVRDYNAQAEAFLAEHPDATIDWLPVGPIFWSVVGMLVGSLLAVGAALLRKRHAA